MLVVEVYVLHPQTLQGGVAGLPHVLGLAAHPEPLAVLAAHVAELGGEHDLVPAVGYGFAHELLVGERAVHVRRVEEGYAQLYSAVDGGYRFLLVARAVELAHPHAPESQFRDLEPLAAKYARLHDSFPW